MREQLEQRLKALKAELETGEKMLTELDAKRANLRETLLRISGAIQVLEEELAKTEQPATNGVEKPGEETGVEKTLVTAGQR
jgi:chromosome segregation ATPase